MKHDGMKGWIDLGSDVNWVDDHGLWGQRTETGTWFIYLHAEEEPEERNS